MIKKSLICLAVAAALVVPLGWTNADPAPQNGVDIVTPEAALYVMGVKLVPLPETPRPFQAIVIGSLVVEVTAETAEEVAFYVDGELQHTDSEAPYTWLWDTGLQPPPTHTLRAEGGGESDEIGVLYVNPFGG